MHPFRWRRRWVVVIGAVSLVAGCVGRDTQAGPRRVDNRPSPPTRVTPTASPPDDGIVDIAVGEPIQAAVDRYPPGTTFRLAAGTHREQAVLPRDGDTFRENPAPSCPGRGYLTDAG